MKINSINLHNFRNYAEERFVFAPGVNVISGENAQGKTNLLEAAAALSTIKLFRTGQKKEGVRFGAAECTIAGEFEAENTKFSVALRLFDKRAAEVWRNGVRMKRQGDARGILKTVLFCPDDLYLIRAGASARRRFLDTALCQLRPNYDKISHEYERLLAHKNRILRDYEEKPSLLETLDDFSLRMARLGAAIIRYRAYYIRKLSEKAAVVHFEAAPHETLQIVYKTVSGVSDPFAASEAIEQQLIDHAMSHRKFELAAHSCLSGPHKDDMDLSINGVSASSFGSQGQVRTCALALKLAERDMFFDDCGEYPVLLLDDVLSELDKKRQDFVLNRIGEGQVIITCCEDDIAEKIHAGKVFTVHAGKIMPQLANR